MAAHGTVQLYSTKSQAVAEHGALEQLCNDFDLAEHTILF